MRYVVLGVVVCAAFICHGSPVALAGDYVLLSPDEIKVEIIGKQQTGKDTSGNYWYLTAKADGTIDVRQGRFQDSGKWYFEGTAYCTEYAKVRNGAKLCQGIGRVSGGYAYVIDGKITDDQRFTVK